MPDNNSLALIEKFMTLRNNFDPAAAASILEENTDPKLRLVAHVAQLLSQQAQEQEQPDREDSVREDSKLNAVNNMQQIRNKLNRMRRRIELLNGEIDRLQEINDTLAVALGACYLCWGADPNCEICHGNGHPGAARPDRELYKEFVVPAVKRMSKTKLYKAPQLTTEDTKN